MNENNSKISREIWTFDYCDKIKGINSLLVSSCSLFGKDVYLRPSESGLPQITFSDLVHFAKMFEDYLEKRGVKKGDSVAVLFHNSSIMVLLFLSIISGKRVFVPINPNSSPTEVSYILDDAKPSIVIFDAIFGDKLKNIANSCKKISIENDLEFINNILSSSGNNSLNLEDSDLDLPAEIVYTSGTTGDPKGVVITHGNLLADSFGIGERFKFSQGDNFLTVTPLFHNSGQILSTLVPLWCGGRTTAVRSDMGLVSFWHYANQYEIDWSLGMPAHVNFLVEGKSQSETRALKGFFCGGAKLEIERQQEFENRYGIPVFNNYGLTETTSFATCDLLCTTQKVPGSVGKPLGCNEVLIIKEEKEVGPNETGEIRIRGRNVFKEYLNKPELTKSKKENGWLHTGDLGYKDHKGYVFIVDRTDNMMLVGGENVYPADVEKFVPRLEGVSEAILSSVPHKILENELVLIYRKKPGMNIEMLKWKKFLNDNLSNFKVPKQYIDIEDLGLKEIPKAPNGKILRNKIKNILVNALT